MLTISRGMTEYVTGGNYPASLTSVSESTNARNLKNRGICTLLANLPSTFGLPLVLSIFLSVLQITTLKHLSTLWRVRFGIGVAFPFTIFYWRVKMVN